MSLLHTQNFQVGPHCFQIRTADLPADSLLKTLLPSLQPFLTDNLKEACFTLDIDTSKEDETTVSGEEIELFEWEGALFSIRRNEQKEFFIEVDPHNGSPKRTLVINPALRKVRTHLQGMTPLDAFILNNFLMMAYAFITAPLGTLLMHASVIRNQSKGYLFLGKSGTGKSTHTQLWLNHIPGSELLNDDNPVVHANEQGEVYVYGSPWSGKTPCYKQMSAPAGAFVRLSQAPRNSIQKEKHAQAFAALLPSCSCLKKDSAIYNGVLDTITRIVTNVPVYHLACLPDKEAADICHNTLTSHCG